MAKCIDLYPIGENALEITGYYDPKSCTISKQEKPKTLSILKIVWGEEKLREPTTERKESPQHTTE